MYVVYIYLFFGYLVASSASELWFYPLSSPWCTPIAEKNLLQRDKNRWKLIEKSLEKFETLTKNNKKKTTKQITEKNYKNQIEKSKKKITDNLFRYTPLK